MNLKGISILSVIISFSNFNCQAEKLQSFKLSEVRILEGPFYSAQQADLNYMLALDVDRLLAPYLKDAGIQPIKDNYGNWENIGLDGHIGGHYLSAMAYMYASTGNTELLSRMNYMIDWLDTCQHKNGNGYVGGIPNGHVLWEEIGRGEINVGNFSLKDRWVPLYNIHKLYAGLRDVYLYTGNKKALKILVQLSDWFYNLIMPLSDDKIQEMLKSEHGGLNEIFADVAEITGNKKYIELAKRISHKAILEPLLHQRNELTGLHANTQIPKVIGYKKIADATDNTEWNKAAEFFWNTVIDKYTVSIGGNSVREHFNPADDYSGMVESNQGPETCNTYNMLRLTKSLYLTDPKAKYIEYYERALFNHILSSEHPVKGGFVYFTPMRPRHYRVYSQPQQCFWCCVGTGLENHGKYGELIYAHDENNLYVNLFIASSLNWTEKGISLVQHTSFPFNENSELKIQVDQPKKFAINIRKPSWTNNDKFEILVNGKKHTISSDSSLYVSIEREWKSGDVINISLPMSNKIEYLPDHSNWVSFLHGPIVLAAISDSNNLDGLWADDSRMGHAPNGPLYPINDGPFLTNNQKDFSAQLIPVAGKPMNFTMRDNIYPEKYKDLVLKPFFDIHEARYIIYWPIMDSAASAKNNQSKVAAENEMLELEARTLDQIAPGEQQPESDHNFNGEKTETGINRNKHWRDATGWFSYTMNNKSLQGKILRITYYGLDRDRKFDILVNDECIATIELKGEKGDVFYDIEYQIPDNILQKSKNDTLKIRFSAGTNSKAGGIYYIRLLK